MNRMNLLGILTDLAGPDFLIIGLIVALFAVPGLIILAVILLVNRRQRRPPPLPKT